MATKRYTRQFRLLAATARHAITVTNEFDISPHGVSRMGMGLRHGVSFLQVLESNRTQRSTNILFLNTYFVLLLP